MDHLTIPIHRRMERALPVSPKYVAAAFFNQRVLRRQHLVGLTVHIKGPGGIVQQDAGQVVFNSDGTVKYIHGPHPQFLGETSGSALAP